MDQRMLSHLEKDVYGIVDRDHAGILMDVMRDNPPEALKDSPKHAFYAVRFAKLAKKEALDLSSYRRGSPGFTAKELEWLVAACDIALLGKPDRSLSLQLYRGKSEMLSMLLGFNHDRKSQVRLGEELISSLESVISLQPKVIPDTAYVHLRLGRSRTKHASLYLGTYRKESLRLVKRAFMDYEKAAEIAVSLDGKMPPQSKSSIFRKASDGAENVASFAYPPDPLLETGQGVGYLGKAAAYSGLASVHPDSYISAISMLNAGRLYMLAFLMRPSDISHFDDGMDAYRNAQRMSRKRGTKTDRLYWRTSAMLQELESCPRSGLEEMVGELLSISVRSR